MGSTERLERPPATSGAGEHGERRCVGGEERRAETRTLVRRPSSRQDPPPGCTKRSEPAGQSLCPPAGIFCWRPAEVCSGDPHGQCEERAGVPEDGGHSDITQEEEAAASEVMEAQFGVRSLEEDAREDPGDD